jgi:hypothetical protein
LIPRLWAALGAVILIVASAAISAFVVSNWNPYSSRDYEDCAARAAKDAKSKDALSVLLSVCRSEFEGRRKAGGGYTYYDSCQQKTFDIKGPNRNPDELENIKKECLAYVDRQAAEEREAQQTEWSTKIEAMSHIHVTFLRDIGCGSVSCRGRFEVTNESDKALDYVLVGLAHTNGDCPPRYAEQHTLRLKISPGEVRRIEGDISAGYGARNSFTSPRLCIEVLDVQFARK